jgi:ABC-type Fe3+/spermidine/putrescine transport system ATPase subunit
MVELASEPAAGSAGQSDAAQAPDVVVRLTGVSKSYGKAEVLHGLNLDIRRGEILTLLGPSGCGKTTTLRLVIGLERCSAGEISHEGQLIDSKRRRVFLPPHKRNMGMVFQSYAIWPHMTVFENVAYPMRARHVRGRQLNSMVGRALELVGLGALASRPATQLSGGQQQRVALARSLVYEPALLLLDEPFSNLDAHLREEMRAEVKVLQRRLATTVLFVTHDQVEAMSLADRIAVVSEGSIAQIGTPEELYRRPSSAAVRDFMGKTVVFQGTLQSQDSAGVARVSLRGDPNLVIEGRADQAVDVVPGQGCSLSVRPEHLTVIAARDLPSGGAPPNIFLGRIEALLYLGERYQAQIRLAWGQDLILLLPPDSTWQEGQAVAVKVPREGFSLWPE